MSEFDSKPPVTPPPSDQANIDAQAQRIPAPPITEQPSDSSDFPVLGQPSKPALPKGTEVNPDPNAVPGSVQPHHSIMASIFQDLAGGQKTTWRQTESGPVPVKENLQPGEVARGILAAALTGLASGYATRGGPGGNKGQAFAAGFEGEQKRHDQQAGEAKKEAQQEFQNKNIADEMTLRKMVNARDQQRSIDEHQEASIRIDTMKRDLAQGNIRDAHENVQWMENQQDKYNLLITAGARPMVGVDGKPVPEFDTNEDLVKWLHTGNNSQLAIQKGNYNTVIATDPVSGKIQILQKPKGWDDPQWVGVKVDKDGKPALDSKGDLIPDGTFRDNNGKVVAPAGPMTPHQLYDSQIRLIDLQSKELSRQEALERLRLMRREREKDVQQSRADEEFNRAGGNPDAIDPKTGQFIVSSSSRTILQQRFIKEGAMQSALLNGVQKEMDRLGAPGPGSTPEERADWNALRQQANEARQNLHQLQVNMGLLSRTPNVAQIAANSIRSQYIRPDGSYDEASAMKAVEALQANSGFKQQLRQLLGSPVDRPIEQLKVGLASIRELPREEQIQHIMGAFLSKKDKDWMVSQLNSDNAKNSSDSAEATPDKLSSVSPDTTLMSDGSIIPNDAVEVYKQRHPSATVVGRGTKRDNDNFGGR